MTPKWIEEARQHLGQKEIPGVKSNVWIKDMWLSLKGGAWFWKTYGEDDSKLPWCGAFTAYVLRNSGFDVPAQYASAKAWATWGQRLQRPAPGCIVVFNRDGGGHVGFVVGEDAKGNLMVLGGNQGDAVNIRPFSVSRVVAYRYPPGLPIPAATMLARLESDGKLSTNEA